MNSRLFFTAMFLLFFCNFSRSQSNNVYDDVIHLRALVDVSSGVPKLLFKDSVQWIAILKKYAGDKSPSTYAELKDLFKNNPFGLGNLIPSTTGQGVRDEQNIKGIQVKSNASPSASVFSAPMIAGALVQVIIKRAKEELSVAFFDKFRKELIAHPELDTLFPKTAEFIINIESYLYAGSLNTLRQAFADDIANLPAQLPAFLNTPEIKKFIGTNPKYKDVWLTLPAFRFLGEILNRGSIADAIKKIFPDPELATVNQNFYNLLRLITTLSESVRDPTGKNDWIDLPTDFANNIIADPVSKNLFFGLLYEEVKDISFKWQSGTALDLKSLITVANINNVQALVSNLITSFSDIKAVVEKVKILKNTGDQVTLDDAIDLINKTTADVKKSVDLIYVFVGSQGEFKKDIDIAFNFIPQVTQIIRNINDTQYSSAVLNSVILVSHYVRNDSTPLVQKFLKYASFMAAIAEAKTQDDVAAALDAAILPVGSSSIKQTTAFSIAINSYIGASYYKEHYNSGAPNNIKVGLPTFGVSLPIGVSFNLGLRNNYVGSLSIFASVIDLGAIASFKLSTPDSVQSKSLPDFTWQNLLAPGAYLVFGRLFNSPLALGFGIQKGPQLRAISYTPSGEAAVDLSDKQTYRLGVFLSVDIPLFHIYSTPYSRFYNR